MGRSGFNPAYHSSPAVQYGPEPVGLGLSIGFRTVWHRPLETVPCYGRRPIAAIGGLVATLDTRSRRWKHSLGELGGASVSVRNTGVRVAGFAVALGLLGACSSSGESADTDPGPSSSAAQSSVPATSAVATVAPSSIVPPTAEASPPKGDLVYLALGDSNVYGAAGDCDSCTTYPTLLAQTITSDTGMSVGLIDGSQHNSLTSGNLLDEIRNDSWGSESGIPPVRTDLTPRQAIAAADLITITVGANMMPWYRDSDPCGKTYDAECIAKIEQPTMSHIDDILKEINTIRGDKPTAVRVTTFHNDLIKGPEYDPAMFSSGSDAFSPETIAQALATARSFLDTWAADMCKVAQDNGAACVDIYRALAGPNGDQPLPGGWYQSNYGDMNQAGQDFYAAEIAKIGFAPLPIGG